MELAIFEKDGSAPVELRSVPDDTKYATEGGQKRFARPVRRVDGAPEAKSWLDDRTGEWVIETPAPTPITTPSQRIEAALKADPLWAALVRFLKANLPALKDMTEQQVIDAIKAHAE
jgi:hypothetical protein